MPDRDKQQPSAPPALHELEGEVMAELWRRDEATVRSLMEALNETAPKARAYTTYLTICQRLDAKGFLKRRRDGKTDIYTPVLTRDEYAKARAGAEVDALVAQFGDQALVHFAREIDQLDAKRRQRLRRLARGG